MIEKNPFEVSSIDEYQFPPHLRNRGSGSTSVIIESTGQSSSNPSLVLADGHIIKTGMALAIGGDSKFYQASLASPAVAFALNDGDGGDNIYYDVDGAFSLLNANFGYTSPVWLKTADTGSPNITSNIPIGTPNIYIQCLGRSYGTEAFFGEINEPELIY